MSNERSRGRDVVLLAGGLGTRLAAVLGSQTPKPLAPVLGRPFLWFIFRFLQDQGLDRVILATGHLADTFPELLPQFVPPGMEVVFSVEESPRGTAGALVDALSLVDSDPFVVMNGDSFVDVPLGPMIDAHIGAEATATLALVSVPDCARFGTVATDGEDRIVDFREKTGLHEPGWINGGVYVLSKAALEPVTTLPQPSLERDVFPRCLGKDLLGFRVNSPFIDIGVPESYAMAAQLLRRRPMGVPMS